MKIQFKLLDSNKTIESKILNALLPDVAQYVNTAITHIKRDISNIVMSSIASSPEYASLISGNLQYELGIPDPMNKIAGLIDIWTRNIQYEYKKPSISNNKIISKFSASMIRADFSDVLYSEYAVVQDMSRGYNLPWLEWLLLNGNATIVKDYQVIIGPNSRSRTGFAIMRNNPATYWKVPSEFAGTINDNWITRAIESASSQIDNLLQKALS